MISIPQSFRLLEFNTDSNSNDENWKSFKIWFDVILDLISIYGLF